MPVAKKPVALVKRPTTTLGDPITVVGDRFMIRLAKELKADLAPPQLAVCYDKLRDWLDSVTAFKENVRDRIVAFVQDNGTQATEKGSMVYDEGGWELTIRPHKTGFDPKKVEALIRAKGLEVDRYMDSEIIFRLNEGKLTDAVAAKKLTPAELETCRYKLTYALQAPKRTE